MKRIILIPMLLTLFTINILAEEIYLDCEPIVEKALDLMAPHELIIINTKDKTFTSKKSETSKERGMLIFEGTENQRFVLQSNETYYGGVGEEGNYYANYWLNRFTLEMGSTHVREGKDFKMTYEYFYQCKQIEGI